MQTAEVVDNDGEKDGRPELRRQCVPENTVSAVKASEDNSFSASFYCCNIGLFMLHF